MYYTTVKNPRRHLTLSFAAALLALAVVRVSPATAQEGSADGAPPAEDARVVGQRAQAQFENFRRVNLPGNRSPSPKSCQESVGLMCYWYDEDSPAPAPEHPTVTAARERLLERLATLAKRSPADNWISGQRVRYLNEAGRHEDALAVAQECEAFGWWCDALEGFALHALRRYPEAESAYMKALGAMSVRERCTWRDITPFLDDDTRRAYIRTTCGDDQREKYEDRVWWFARTRYGMPGNDSRTEHYSRLVYIEFLREAPSAFRSDFDDAEHEILLRFGWPVAWGRGQDRPVQPGEPRSSAINVVGIEATPAHRLIPPYYVLANPAVSDSIHWAVQLPPVVARYHPPYAKKIAMLEHQQALFRRGDTALVVLAYDVSKVKLMKGARLHASLTLTPGIKPSATQTIVADAPARGTMTVRAPWGPLLMSAEIAADSASVLARARYGIRPPFGVGARVILSDLLFYRPYGSFPTNVEDVLPHAIPTQRVRSREPLGVYWEAYNTNPAGERMTISLTVVPETEESRGLLGRALRLSRESQPVSLTIEDMSALASTMSPRAVQVDISTLKAGDYLVQLEISVAGQYVIRADRRLVVTGQ